MIDRFRILSTVPLRLKEQRISLPKVLHAAGLPPGFFQQEKYHVTTAQLFAFWHAVGTVSSDPAIGLKLGADDRLECFEPSAIAAICSRNFHDAVERMGRYKQLVCPEEINLHAGSRETAVEFVFLEARELEPFVLVDNCLAWMVAMGGRGTGGRITPVRVELRRAAKHRTLLEKHFGCRVTFKARRNAVVFRTADMDIPFTTYNAELLAVLGAQLDSQLAAHKSSIDVGGRVKQVLLRTLAGSRPSIQHVAAELGMSARTLQRKLADARITFQHLVEGTRRELAHHYLRQRTVELQDTAYLLGYEDPNSFFRAFHTWEGVTPGEWRTRVGTVA
ncbi:MAG: AraC family transcriptional regulator ligand-binding domain-containing protein [Bacteroidetes bacterium]|nr:AraC family transcriptional regulator ligand-binding domain-containing protein [Bacteroidota bacterium]